MISSTASTSSLAAASFLQRAETASSCQVSEIQLTGGSLLQLDQPRDQPTSLAFGIPPIRPLSVSPAACASRHAAAAASSPMDGSMDGGVTGRAEVGMGGSRVSRHVSPDMHQDSYKIDPSFMEI